MFNRDRVSIWGGHQAFMAVRQASHDSTHAHTHAHRHTDTQTHKHPIFSTPSTHPIEPEMTTRVGLNMRGNWHCLVGVCKQSDIHSETIPRGAAARRNNIHTAHVNKQDDWCAALSPLHVAVLLSTNGQQRRCRESWRVASETVPRRRGVGCGR
jgi:hypothetical protein